MEFISDAVKNLSRRRFRTLLSMAGVGIGVFSFLIMGSMAEHFNRISVTFNKIFQNRVFISEKPSFWAGGGILSISKAEKAKSLPGVKKAVPVLITRRDSNALMVIGIPQMVVGVEPEDLDTIVGGYGLLKGNADLSKHDSAVVGFDAAFSGNERIPEKITIEGRIFHVSGILQKTGGITDGQIFIRLSDAQQIYNREGLITSVIVIPAPGKDPESLALELKENISGVKVIPPSRFRAQVESSLKLWNALTLGASLVAVAAGVLCIIIVMLGSVSERTVEIGIKKALGAENLQLMAEFTVESAVTAVAGWIIGAISALLFIRLASARLLPLGTSLFEITPRLLWTAFFGTVLLGILSGIPPAWRASEIEPASAMKPRY